MFGVLTTDLYTTQSLALTCEWVGGESRVRVYGVLQAVLCSSFSKSLRVFTRWEGVKVSVDPERHKMLYDQSVCSSLQWKERTFSFSSVAHC